jgi:hypothetical protein
MTSAEQLQNRIASRFVELTAEAADASDINSVVTPIQGHTRAEKVALELAVFYLTQRGLLQTRQCAYAESSSSFAAAHRDDWPSRILHLTPRGDSLRKLMHVHLQLKEEDSEPEDEPSWIKISAGTEHGVVAQLPVSRTLQFPLECSHIDIATEDLGIPVPEDDEGESDDEAAELGARIAQNAIFALGVAE